MIFYVVAVNNRPYIMDLDSTNGTFLNGKKVESRRYYGIDYHGIESLNRIT